MKKLFALIAVSLILTSCAQLYFVDIQPKGAKFLTEFPEELHGAWKDDKGGMQIDFDGITEMNIKKDTENNLQDTTYRKLILNDTLKLYKAKELYVFHNLQENGYWSISVVTIHKNGDIYLYYSDDPHVFAGDSELKLEEATFNIDNEKKIVKTLDPDYNESRDFESAVFSGQMNIKSLRKIISEDYLLTILKSDGTVFHPDDDDSE